jgi:MoaA/NifB/PqqE/SkfB family radical SAM enzyme
VTWHTEYRAPGLAELEDCRPYLSSLLQTADRDVALARSRVDNWLEARHAERVRPDTVPAMPYHVVLDPATICNLRCPLCVQATDPLGRRRGLLDLSHYRMLLDEIAPHVIRLDLFNWGEPLLHPQFAEVVQLAADVSIWTRTSTNLSHSADFAAERIIESGLRYLVVSIDGATQATYQRYRVRGLLPVVLRNLAALIAARDRLGVRWPTIEWQYLVMSHNTHEIAAAATMAADLGVDVFRHGGARGRMATKLRLSSSDNVAESAPLLVDPTHPASEYTETGAKRRSGEREGCRWLWGKAALNPDGGVAPCVSSWFQADDLGTWRPDGRDVSLRRVWNGPAYRKARGLARTGGDPADASVCAQCAHHRNFVPTPDNDREPLPDRGELTAFADALGDVGCEIGPGVVTAVADGLAAAGSRLRGREPSGGGAG